MPYPSPIFGPIHSRRLGISLGINLLPGDGKACTFDCIYCECGLNKDNIPHEKFPTRQAVSDALRLQLQKMQDEQTPPDVLTFAGNGEPTLHPDFAGIIDDTISLRDEFFPNAKVSVLSNATQLHRQDVFDALMRIDNNILKLDTISMPYIKMLDQPVSRNYDVDDVIRRMTEFRGHCIVQTMFLTGTSGGHDVDNTTDEYVLPWIEAVRRIRPSMVMIYTIDRKTPIDTLAKATHQQLDRIAAMVNDAGIPCQASY